MRERAYGDESGNISAAELTLYFIIDERSRELHWEAQRRTDLIRFDLFSGDAFVWKWKGGVKDGKATGSQYELLAIPASDIALNPNLEQNPEF